MIRETLWMLWHVKGGIQWKLRVWLSNLNSWHRFWRSYRQYQRISPSFAKVKLKHLYPCLGDDISVTPLDPIYFYQDAWAFEKILHRNPLHHVDVGSHHKFAALLSKVIPVTFVDIRPLSLPLSTLNFACGSILHLPFRSGSLISLSSLCVVEHIGLGRYGDPLDPEGTEKAIEELKLMIKPGGDLYISLPVDDENRIYFNAHRAFDEKYLLELFAPFHILERSYIRDREFDSHRKPGFCIACYQLMRPS
jgi:SAM-dependent methyltransferase